MRASPHVTVWLCCLALGACDSGSESGGSGAEGGTAGKGGSGASGGVGAGGSGAGGSSAGSSQSGGAGGSGGAGTGGGATGGTATGGAATGGVAAGGSAGTTGGAAGAGAPDFEEQFDTPDPWTARAQSDGRAQSGVDASGAEDGKLLELLVPGHPELASGDRVGPSFASEVASPNPLGYGTYRTRVELGRCAAGEEVVNGTFTYAYGGDVNQNGITDNREIDIEILCGEPSWIWLSAWTDYESDSNFLRTSRVINTATGEYHESVAHDAYGIGPVLGTLPGAKQPSFPEAGAFYEMGFEWQPTKLRFFVRFATEDVELWSLESAELVPQAPAPMLFNLWHARDHWATGGAADYPAQDSLMRVDWFRFWAQN